ncbi:hypothetical protein [Nocardioides gilvus]|uniref:hypothetical protein n=1 Tax=Nocardioides gilvus TaxID=1735589 RepID=UPI000D74FAF1|nr:hypothetical protein [Nocardioides gilvus]
MSEFTPNRRTVIRTAAWSAPVVAVAAASPAFATTPPAGEVTYQTVNKRFVFHPTLGGAPLTTVDILVDVEARVPLEVPAGLVADPAQTVSTVTIPALLVGIIAGPLGDGSGPPAEVGGTSTSTSRLSGTISLDSITPLTIDRAPWPAGGGDLVTIARGTGAEALPVPAGLSGPVTITLQPPVSELQGYAADGTALGVYASALAPKAGQDYTIATFNIV